MVKKEEHEQKLLKLKMEEEIALVAARGSDNVKGGHVEIQCQVSTPKWSFLLHSTRHHWRCHLAKNFQYHLFAVVVDLLWVHFLLIGKINITFSQKLKKFLG